MADRPILFSDSMIQANLLGYKSETRRVMKPQPSKYTPTTVAPQLLRGVTPRHPKPYFDAYNGGPYWCWWDEYDRQGPDWIKCPYGKIGDELWVREKFMTVAGSHIHPKYGEARRVKYMADGAVSDWLPVPEEYWDKPTTQIRLKINQARFMPKWASDIKLKITGISAEPLQDIKLTGVKAEGIQVGVQVMELPGMTKKGMNLMYLNSFIELWDRINSARGFFWSENPWVWVIQYELISSGRLKSCH